ncbi:uncharacterized protein LOC110225151 isoform X2 [Arabidopsis lyrata subsp. lyrata]|uniref:uncharacterized protein LOC110225151 isoform X2 n=1 Tax=Arabidopsis lyrata subsp. lyrata TaxID=81972 RepID=UPI000A29BE55|nr:uncharacterized protein LOC110225151 isoform X2 [Arabidopsis lyrata subsp. lyrata]|eukprot:XP_020869753.1 uncharacterized protein LOC110225151 isoform X2 [Arabidopsis lyrata subsp. lyrata]
MQIPELQVWGGSSRKTIDPHLWNQSFMTYQFRFKLPSKIGGPTYLSADSSSRLFEFEFSANSISKVSITSSYQLNAREGKQNCVEISDIMKSSCVLNVVGELASSDTGYLSLSELTENVKEKLA